MAEARQWGLADRVIETGYVDDDALPEYLVGGGCLPEPAMADGP